MVCSTVECKRPTHTQLRVIHSEVSVCAYFYIEHIYSVHCSVFTWSIYINVKDTSIHNTLSPYYGDVCEASWIMYFNVRTYRVHLYWLQSTQSDVGCMWCFRYAYGMPVHVFQRVIINHYYAILFTSKFEAFTYAIFVSERRKQFAHTHTTRVEQKKKKKLRWRQQDILSGIHNTHPLIVLEYDFHWVCEMARNFYVLRAKSPSSGVELFAFSSKYIHIIRETLWCVRPSCRPRTRIHRNQNQSRWIVIYIYRDIEIYRCTLCVYSVWRLLPWKAFVSTSWRFTLISASNAYIKMQYKCVWRTNICIWNTFQLPKKKP